MALPQFSALIHLIANHLFAAGCAVPRESANDE
jgi:hypothetical protein